MSYDERFPPDNEIQRVDPEDACEQIAPQEALQVCDYAAEEKRRAAMVDGVLTLEDLERLAPPRDRKLILYCA